MYVILHIKRFGKGAEVKVYVVMRFDPMQCGACGNGNLDKIFTTIQGAEAYVADAGRPGVSWEIKERDVDTQAAEAAAVTAA